MNPRKNSSVYIILVSLSALLHSYGAGAQEDRVQYQMTFGDRLREEYRFAESAEAYTRGLEMAEDSLLKMKFEDRLLLARNGQSMSAYTYDDPVVVARRRFHIDEFFLYYPLADKGWRPVPNPLDPHGGTHARALYCQGDEENIYFSAKDEDGVRNIYVTSLKDTLWSLPTLVNEYMTSAADEIYPMLSPDGKKMYFASAGLFGVGGYDLYESEWNEEENDWSAPVNMGFPYSSPADDFLLVNSPDGKYTVFASNRGCPADSVCVYVLEYDTMPVRRAVEDSAELLRLSRLELTGTSADPVSQNQLPMDEDTRRYADKMRTVQSLRDSISCYGTSLEDERERFALSTDEVSRSRLADRILRKEAMLPRMQAALDGAMAQLQQIEMELLLKGIVIDPDKLMASSDSQVSSGGTSYAFRKLAMGDSLDIVTETPEPKFDYSFKILDVGQFAEDNTIPSGICYQIQIFSSTYKAKVSSLKGLSPVFEIRTANGRHTYRVGLFSTYNDVLSHLNAVKRVGFRSAFIVAYVDGKEMAVAKVRNLENERKKAQPQLYQVFVRPEGGDLDAVVMDGIRQQASGKDIARSDDGKGNVLFVIGPYGDKGKADELAAFARAMGAGSVEVKAMGK